MNLEYRCEYLQIRKMAMDFVGAFFNQVPLKAVSKNFVFRERSMKEERKLLSGTFKIFLFSLVILLYNKAVEGNYVIL